MLHLIDLMVSMFTSYKDHEHDHCCFAWTPMTIDIFASKSPRSYIYKAKADDLSIRSRRARTELDEEVDHAARWSSTAGRIRSREACTHTNGDR
jgi:hypothetical protein